MKPTPIFYMSSEKIDDDLLKTKLVSIHERANPYPRRIPNPTAPARYPHIESIRIISKSNTPSATVKIRRRVSPTGGPAVVRTYSIYSVKWLMIWQACQTMLFKIHYEAKP